jgi:acyl-CoA hydrolase
MEKWVRIAGLEVSGDPGRLVGALTVTMVAVDASGNPLPVPLAILMSPEGRKRFDERRQRTEGQKRSRRRP